MKQDHDPMRPVAVRRLAACVLATLVLVASLAAQAAGNRLTGMDTVSAGGGEVTLRLTLSGPAPVPSVFTVDDPARLSIDLPDTGLDLDQRYQRVAQGPVQAISAAAAGGRTRVVVELGQMVAYGIRRHGDQILVHLGDRAADTANVPRSSTGPSTAATPTTDDDQAQASAIRNIDFRRGDKGSGRVDIQFNGANAPVNVTESNGQVIADIPGVSLPARLQKRLDVTDFATPVQTIDAMSRGGGTHLVITPTPDADYEQLAYQTGHDFYIELQPLTPAEQAQRQRDNPKYTGKKISLSFQNIDIRQVLQIIADVANVNMVVSDSVTGSMALRLQDVPWDQALDIIMQSKGLGMKRENNVITVAPLAEIAAREQAEAVAKQATTNLAPLHSEIIQINYAHAADIANLLRSAGPSATSTATATQGTPLPANGGQDTGDLSLLSPRGQVTVDERTNSLLITDTRENIDQIRRVINRLDIPVRQVLIESRIVVANREFERNLGVTLGVNDRADAAGNTGGFTVDLPPSDSGGTFSTTLIGKSFNLDLALSALETENQGEIISSPRVITANAKEAKIEQGVEIPYLEAASSGAATVEFKNAVLSLTVTPQITPDERVIMDLYVTQDTQGDSINVQGGGSVPSIDTRSLTTQVLVNDGETVVLGGIYEQEDRNIANRIPILGEMPLIGPLFRNTDNTHTKRELLLFVTPKILKQSLKIP